MITKTHWELNKPDADETDAIFLSSLGCTVEVCIPEPMEFSTLNGTQVRYTPSNTTIKITTTCKKQESMLYLKYGDALRLVSKIHTKIIPYEN